jgi:hypothetical protein
VTRAATSLSVSPPGGPGILRCCQASSWPGHPASIARRPGPPQSPRALDSSLLEVLVRALEDAAVRDGHGRILYWTRFSRHADLDAEPSPALTARVPLAMQHCAGRF